MAIANFIPQIWAAALLEAFHESETVSPTVNREYEGDAASGNTVNVTTVTTPAIVDYKAAGRVLNAAALADTTIALSINQEKAYGFKVDDIDRVQAAGSFDAVTRDAAAALVEDAEAFIMAQMVAGGTNDNGGTPAAVTNFTTAYTALVKMRTGLGKAKAPMSERYAAVNPDFASFLLGPDSTLVKVNEAGGPGELRNGVLGRLAGFTIVESALLNPAKPAAVAYHRSAMAYVNQVEKPESLRDTASFSDIVRGLHVYGAKVVRPTSVRVYVSA